MFCRTLLRTAKNQKLSFVLSQRLASTVPKDKWDLYAGVLVERPPVVSATVNPLEKEFQEMLWKIEYENSLKSDFEMQHEREQHQAELIRKGTVEVDLDDTASKQTAQDLKDAYIEELKKFQFAPRVTEDDKTNNTTSTNRALEDTLFLIVEHKLGNQSHLLLPQGLRLDGETMRQTAERVVREKCGEKMQVEFYGNAPCGFYKYKYPNSARGEAIGVKIFFFRAALRKGNVDKSLKNKFEWITKPLMEDKIKSESYCSSVDKFLF